MKNREMSDLISRSALLEALKKYEEECENAMCIPGYAGALYVVLEQPIACDIDKVVDKMETEGKAYVCGDGYGADGRVDWFVKVVKRGGQNEID